MALEKPAILKKLMMEYHLHMLPNEPYTTCCSKCLPDGHG